MGILGIPSPQPPPSLIPEQRPVLGSLPDDDMFMSNMRASTAQALMLLQAFPQREPLGIMGTPDFMPDVHKWNTDLVGDIRKGFRASVLGHMAAEAKHTPWRNFADEPDYDPFKDKQVREDQFPIVATSRSSAETAHRLRAYRMHERAAEEAMKANWVGMFIGEQFGDPANYAGFIPVGAVANVASRTLRVALGRGTRQFANAPLSVVGAGIANGAFQGTISAISEMVRQGQNYDADSMAVLNSALLGAGFNSVFGMVQAARINRSIAEGNPGSVHRWLHSKAGEPGPDPAWGVPEEGFPLGPPRPPDLSHVELEQIRTADRAAPDLDARIGTGVGSQQSGRLDPTNDALGLPDMQAHRPVETKLGIEKLPINLVTRLLQASVPGPVRTLFDMLDVGLYTNKNLEGMANTADTVMSRIRILHLARMTGALDEINKAWMDYRGVMHGKGPIRDDLAIVKTMVTDMMGNGDGITLPEFFRRVGRATRDGVDSTQDAASPKVLAAADRARAHLEEITQRGVDAGFFMKVQERQLAALNKAYKFKSGVEPGSNAPRATPDELENLKARIWNVSRDLEEMANNGGKPVTRNSRHYLPRIYLREKIKQNLDHFKSRIQEGLMMEKGLSLEDAKKASQSVADEVLKLNGDDEFQSAFEGIIDVGFGKARTLDISDRWIADYLEDDISQILRVWTRRMAPDVELTQKFGYADMADYIDMHKAEYDDLLRDLRNSRGTPDEPPDVQAKIDKLVKEREEVVKDLTDARDMVRGTFGAALDPDRMSSRVIRQLRNATIITTLGGAGITNLIDIGRSVMVNGLGATLDYAWKPLVTGTAKSVRGMVRHELQQMMWAYETVAQSHAFSLADSGDVFQSRSLFERVMDKTANAVFLVNGMNYGTQLMMEWAGLVAMGRMNDAILNEVGHLGIRARRAGQGASGPRTAATVRPFEPLPGPLRDLMPDGTPAVFNKFDADFRAAVAQGDDVGMSNLATTLRRRVENEGGVVPLEVDQWIDSMALAARRNADDAAATRNADPLESDTVLLRQLGLSAEDVRAIAREIDTADPVDAQFANNQPVVLPNTERWTDQELALRYRSALNKFMQRHVPSPQVGQRATWTSTEWGSLITMYRGFAQSAVMGGMIPGMQEGQQAFWLRSSMLVGLATMADALREVMNGRDPRDKKIGDILLNGVDRSGVLGWFADVNNATERLTQGGVGVRPLAATFGLANRPGTSTAQLIGTFGGPVAGQVARTAINLGDAAKGKMPDLTHLIPMKNHPLVLGAQRIADPFIKTQAEARAILGVNPEPAR